MAPSDLVAVVGALAGTLTTLSFVPQVVKSWRRRSVSDLSATMLLAFTSGIALWIVYGMAIADWPLIVANIVTLALALALVGMKLTFR